MRNRISFTAGYKRRMRENITEFIIENVTESSIFDNEDYETLAQFITNDDEYDSPIIALCDYFSLGLWFEQKMEQVDFDIEDFMIALRNELNERGQMSAMDI